MNKKNIATIKRIVVFSLVLAITMVNTIVFAAEDNTHSELDVAGLEYGTSVTYDKDTKEITYGEDQNYTATTSYVIADITENEDNDALAVKENNAIGNNISILSDNDEKCIIGKDDRLPVSDTKASPYRNICKVEATFSDGNTFVGSGILVYKNVLLTAGHLVYRNGNGGWATTIRVFPGMNGYNNIPFGDAYDTRITTNTGWINNEDAAWDWAIVDLDKSFDTWQSYGYYYDYNNQVGKQVTAIGYPNSDQYRMYYDTNKVKEASDRTLKILCDSEKGQSGGPVIDVNSGVLVGIIKGGNNNVLGMGLYTSAVRLNEDLCNRLKAHQQEVQ